MTLIGFINPIYPKPCFSIPLYSYKINNDYKNCIFVDGKYEEINEISYHIIKVKPRQLDNQNLLYYAFYIDKDNILFGEKETFQKALKISVLLNFSKFNNSKYLLRELENFFQDQSFSSFLSVWNNTYSINEKNTNIKTWKLSIDFSHDPKFKDTSFPLILKTIQFFISSSSIDLEMDIVKYHNENIVYRCSFQTHQLIIIYIQTIGFDKKIDLRIKTENVSLALTPFERYLRNDKENAIHNLNSSIFLLSIKEKKRKINS